MKKIITILCVFFLGNGCTQLFDTTFFDTINPSYKEEGIGRIIIIPFDVPGTYTLKYLDDTITVAKSPSLGICNVIFFIKDSLSTKTELYFIYPFLEAIQYDNSKKYLRITTQNGEIKQALHSDEDLIYR